MAGRSVIAVVTVAGIDQVSPTFTRVEFASPELAEFGTGGPIYDQRIKLIFPGATGQPPQIAGSDDWYDRWLAVPEAERGSMRTYSIRDLYGEGADRRLVVDFVLHLQPGFTGPASLWASQADVGQQLVVVGPRRGVARAGIEFQPGTASTILLAGDETAVPAMSRILEDLPAHTAGYAYVEVPDPADVLPLNSPDGVAVRWLPRGHAPVGHRLIPEILTHFGSTAVVTVEGDVDDNLWETPTYSSSGGELTTSDGIAGLYAWIAGESGVVTSVRRHLVKEVGIERRQVAFMGYWRRGVAMRGRHPVVRAGRSRPNRQTSASP